MRSESTYIVGKNLSREKLRSDLWDCVFNKEIVGIDSETEGINPKVDAGACGKGKIICWSVSTPRYPQVFLWADQLDYFKPWLESAAPKVGHNIFSFDYHMFANMGIELGGIFADTKRLSRLLYSCKTRSHGLKDLARNWLGIEQPSYKSLFTRTKHTIEYVQEKRKVKGYVELLDERATKLKVGEHKGVPTLLVTGERGRFGAATELIPLSEIPTLYPSRLEALYEYASLDAQLTRLLFHAFRKELQRVGWKVSK